MKYLLQTLLACILITSCESTASAPASTFSLLLFSKADGYYHESIPAGLAAIRSLGAQYGFDVVATTDSTVFTDENLAPHRVVVFFNTTGDVLNAGEQAALERFVHHGGGFVGIHSASDTEKEWPWYGRLIGALFENHSEIRPGAVVRADAKHSSTEGLPDRWTRTDEWYNFVQNPAPHVRVLLTVDETSYVGGKMGDHHPIAWLHEFEGGRVWYTAMGHTVESYREPEFLRHLLGGILWAGRAESE